MRTALDPTSRYVETWEAWVAAMQVSYALFASSVFEEGSTVTCRIDHENRTLPTTGPQYYTNASNWITAFYLATICREKERKQWLCRIPVELLRQAGQSEGTVYNEHIYHWIGALQAYTRGNEQSRLTDELTSAIKLSHPDRAQVGDAETLNKRVFPPMDLFRLFIQRKITEFNESLASALRMHKEYFTATEERAEDIDGVVALGPLAIACMAYDAGYWDPEFQLEVESEYMPKHLLERSWYGEFPT
ncbi:immunity 49 family protein [Haloactinospora alba]|uniref:immunity 49 family protein n=1 Tax=Haloactinospora alba TaxID=405555 RepID=UPI00114D71EC|nr:immunity 49 family protein [Haloactinospora alba]